MRPSTARLITLSLLLPAAALADADPRLPVLGAMRAELDRSMARLRLPGYEAPYFMSYAVRDHEGYVLVSKLGALHADEHRHNRRARVEVRVGDYQMDNTSPGQPEIFDLGGGETFSPEEVVPLDDAGDVLRSTLWLLTDVEYKEALAAYARKRGKRATTLSEDESLPSFSREPPVKSVAPALALRFDGALRGPLRRASERFRRHPEILDGAVRLEADHVTRFLVSSEGTEVVSERVIWGLLVTGAVRAPDGMLLEHEKAFYAAEAAGLPDEAAMARAVDELVDELLALRRAPKIDPYTGPAILMQQAAGVFFHEAVGHRLEGERQNDENEGGTFKGQIGQRILPEFLSVVDDPTLRSAAGATLNGHYLVDDEGVKARPVTLIEKGVLRDYLMSRSPITGSTRSNGHGRAEGTGDPIGRMANLLVQSTRQVSEAALKRMLLDEVRRQHKPFGLLVRDITGGSTNTSSFGPQAFKGQPRLVYRVDAKTGAETLVRGVDMVGTPLATIGKILATSDKLGVFNGFCGAESGPVPVSTVAPAILMGEIELQRKQRALERPTILPPPWADPAKK